MADVGVGRPLTGGDMAISTQSTLRASAHSGGCRVLGSCPLFTSLGPSLIVVAKTHPRTTLQVDVRRRGVRVGIVSPRPPSVVTPPHYLLHLIPIPLILVHPPLIHPASSCSQRWWWCWWLLWAWGHVPGNWSVPGVGVQG